MLKFQGDTILKSMPEIVYYNRNPDKKVPVKIDDKDSKGESLIHIETGNR